MKAYVVISSSVQRRGISNAELARRVGMDQELLRRSLSGERKIAADEFVALCEELELSLDDFKAVA